MKKIALLVLVSIPLHAGRVFVGDPKDTLSEMKSKLLSIRTRFGYDLPPEEESQEPISLDAQLQLIKEFETLLYTYRSLSPTLENSFTSTNNFICTEQEKKFFDEVAREFEKDKKRYASFTARALITIRRTARPRNRLVTP